jgi:hypothetical protein
MTKVTCISCLKLTCLTTRDVSDVFDFVALADNTLTGPRAMHAASYDSWLLSLPSESRSYLRLHLNLPSILDKRMSSLHHIKLTTSQDHQIPFSHGHNLIPNSTSHVFSGIRRGFFFYVLHYFTSRRFHLLPYVLSLLQRLPPFRRTRSLPWSMFKWLF